MQLLFSLTAGLRTGSTMLSAEIPGVEYPRWVKQKGCFSSERTVLIIPL